MRTSILCALIASAFAFNAFAADPATAVKTSESAKPIAGQALAQNTAATPVEAPKTKPAAADPAMAMKAESATTPASKTAATANEAKTAMTNHAKGSHKHGGRHHHKANATAGAKTTG